jgi:hypothetical protein
MSTDNYNKARAIIDRNPSISYFVGPRSEELVRSAEQRLGLRFSPLYRDFLLAFGALSFGAQEIYGVVNANFENSRIPDAIWCTLTERAEVNMPSHLVTIYHTGFEEYFCLDFSRLNGQNEPSVVSFAPGFPPQQQKYELIAEDFGDFLLDLVSREAE